MSTGDKKSGEIAFPNKSVGYRNPPVGTRFQKGVSGNPKGRPKGSLNLATAFMKTLRERVVINENGRRRTVTKLEAALKQLVNKAASGELRALAQLVALSKDAEAKQLVQDTQQATLTDSDQEVLQDVMKRFRQATQPEEFEVQPEEK